MIVLIELALLAIVLALAMFRTIRVGAGIPPWRRFSRAVSRSDGVAVAIVGGAALTIGAALAILRPPVPMVHDEFAYLLSADTYAHGRLANPPHPHWKHFESYHLIMQPTYASKYPPGQGLALAAGQLLGHPVLGVIATFSLAVAAACWMLQAWVPRRWAFFGALLLAVHSGFQIHFGSSYWGGAIAMLGGCLLFGAIPRFIATSRARYAVLMAAGIGIFALTRPLEGLVATLGAAIVFVVQAHRQGRPVVRTIARAALPATPVLALTLGLLGYNNYAITGSWTKLPYSLNHEQYAPQIPFFVWQTPSDGPVPYRHAMMEQFYTHELGNVQRQRTWEGYAAIKGMSALQIWRAFLGVALTVPCLMVPWVIRRQEYREVIVAAVLFLAVLAGLSWMQSHYLAPGMGLLLLVILQATRELRASPFWNGRLAFAGLVGLFAISAGLRYYVHFSQPLNWHHARDRLVKNLEKRPQKDLVFVRYRQDHNPYFEWVYNRADIDAAHVVWAREMDADSNSRLVDYFRGRAVWLVLADEDPPKLIRDRHAEGAPESDPDNRKMTENRSSQKADVAQQ